jgi:hypothetical protein
MKRRFSLEDRRVVLSTVDGPDRGLRGERRQREEQERRLNLWAPGYLGCSGSPKTTLLREEESTATAPCPVV